MVTAAWQRFFRLPASGITIYNKNLICAATMRDSHHFDIFRKLLFAYLAHGSGFDKVF